MHSENYNKLNKTPLYNSHVSLCAKIVEFSGWLMPLNYSEGIIKEHLTTRKRAGLFDISHMGRFTVSGKKSLPFLQHVLTNNAAALKTMESQYTIISDENGIALDDAYLYRFYEDQYLLVLNASNSEKVKNHLIKLSNEFDGVFIKDITNNLSMIGLQGPKSREILNSAISSGTLPDPIRNKLSIVNIDNVEVLVARTGYTGESIGFELFLDSENTEYIWNLLIRNGASPVGLGARDTLRLEAGLPLYGNELGENRNNKIPVFASMQSRIAVSFTSLKGNYIGKSALSRQFKALKEILDRKFSKLGILPKIIMQLELLEKGIARPGDKIYYKNNLAGYVTSGTAVPYWITRNANDKKEITDESALRSIALALIDSRRWKQDIVEVKLKDKYVKAVIMPYLLKAGAPPYSYSITSKDILKEDLKKKACTEPLKGLDVLVRKTLNNNAWRQKECINLIPSEMTQSKIVKMLSVMDSSGRYAEHKKLKDYGDLEVFYYQGTGFISEVEELLKNELREYLGCNQVETRLISGQMANTAVFSAIVDFLNRTDRKTEPKRISQVLNHHIIKGGHLSSQPMGALKDFVAIDPLTEKPSVIDFPTIPGNPYKVDIEETKKVIIHYMPKLIIFGKSMVLYREPVSEIKNFVNDINLSCFIVYDMAHVLGLIGPHFQKPFKEGADLVTGSTHKTFFGTQRGVIGCDLVPNELKYELWETIETRTFPGSVSNHHLGTLLGLLAAAIEMNHFKDSYQNAVLSNARAFAKALYDSGLSVAGDKDDGYTQTHQVILEVGFARGHEISKRLEENNIITNYQATPDEEGFTASGAIRMGVAEMTRFGMKEEDFVILANYINEVVKNNKNIKDKIKKFRSRFLEMGFCFDNDTVKPMIEKLYKAF